MQMQYADSSYTSKWFMLLGGNMNFVSGFSDNVSTSFIIYGIVGDGYLSWSLKEKPD